MIEWKHKQTYLYVILTSIYYGQASVDKSPIDSATTVKAHKQIAAVSESHEHIAKDLTQGKDTSPPSQAAPLITCERLNEKESTATRLRANTHPLSMTTFPRMGFSKKSLTQAKLSGRSSAAQAKNCTKGSCS
jgi:hypothetical protein